MARADGVRRLVLLLLAALSLSACGKVTETRPMNRVRFGSAQNSYLEMAAATLGGGLLIYAVDIVIHHAIGHDATITAVVREWSESSIAPEIIYLVVALALYLHLFRGWL